MHFEGENLNMALRLIVLSETEIKSHVKTDIR